eukprot:9495378-Lingulodinium_polyedra.AAC.1
MWAAQGVHAADPLGHAKRSVKQWVAVAGKGSCSGRPVCQHRGHANIRCGPAVPRPKGPMPA